MTDYEDNEDVSEEAEAKVVGSEDEDEEDISKKVSHTTIATMEL